MDLIPAQTTVVDTLKCNARPVASISVMWTKWWQWRNKGLNLSQTDLQTYSHTVCMINNIPKYPQSEALLFADNELTQMTVFIFSLLISITKAVILLAVASEQPWVFRKWLGHVNVTIYDRLFALSVTFYQTWSCCFFQLSRESDLRNRPDKH